MSDSESRSRFRAAEESKPESASATESTREPAPATAPAPAASAFSSPIPLSARPSAVIPGMFERQSLNLLVGSSGSGKTQMLLSQLESFATGGEFLGCARQPGSPAPQLGAIIAQRTYSNLFFKLEAFPFLAIQANFPIRVWQPAEDRSDLDNLLEAVDDLARRGRKKPDLVVVEGLQLLMAGSATDARASKKFCRDLYQVCEQRDIAILGTVGTAKMKRGEYYPQLADRVYGAASWAHEADTLIGIERLGLHLPAGQRPSMRKVIVQTEGRAERAVYLDFDDQGRLMPCATPEQLESASAAFQALDARLDQEKPGKEFRREDFLLWGDDLSLSVRTVDRWIASRSSPEMGFLQKSGNTRTVIYRKPVPV